MVGSKTQPTHVDPDAIPLQGAADRSTLRSKMVRETMQKAGLLAALIGTVGLTVYAYPGADKRTRALIQSQIEADREGLTLSALDKLKATTRPEHPAGRVEASLVQPPATLPAPRVMGEVRQELQARSLAADKPATPPAVQPVVVRPTAAMQAGPAGGGANGIEKLAARLPVAIPVPSQPAVRPIVAALAMAGQATPSPAQNVLSTTVVISTLSTPASAPGTGSGPTAGSAQTQAPPPIDPAAAAKTERAPAKPERKRALQRPAAFHMARISQPSSTPNARMATAPSVFRRTDGM